MEDQLQTMRRLGQGQKARLTIDTGDPIEVRVNQMEYDPESQFRVEITTDATGDYGRYQADANYENGEWTPLSVKRYDRTDNEWVILGDVEEVFPREMFSSYRSSDMDAQAKTGSEGIHTQR